MARSITVDNVSKSYRLGAAQHTMLREALMGLAARCLGRRSPAPVTKWALRDVSLSVDQGEVVGLVGRNGAGKSTLLKILSRITFPTSGQIEVHGRVGSLLEVGTGFHDELTGRENVYMNGSILGMRKREIDRQLDEIVAFADIGEYLDTPIKRYSSGMRMRLGFSIAAHLRTEVLFVDEVLAVGDVSFQKKCLGTMKELANGGRTVIFVSHNMAAVENLCTRAVWLANGRIEEDGGASDVIRAYLHSFGSVACQSLDLRERLDRQGTGDVRFESLELLEPGGAPAMSLCSGDSLTVRLRYQCRRDIRHLHFGVRIFSHLGTLLTDLHTWGTGQELPLAPAGRGCIDFEVDGLNLMPGSYYLGVWASSADEWHDVLDHVTRLEIETSDVFGTGRGIDSRFGLMYFPCRWRPVEELPDEESPIEETLREAEK